jgi:hypothetical protein
VIFCSQLTFVHFKFSKPALKTWVILYRGGKNLETLVTYLYKELNKEQALLFFVFRTICSLYLAIKKFLLGKEPEKGF